MTVGVERSLVVLALLAGAFVGCTTLHPLNSNDYAGSRLGTIHLTTTDGAALLLRAPQFVGDTVTGEIEGQVQKIPLSQVRTIEVARPAPWRTAGLVIWSAVAISELVLAEHAALDGSTCYTPAGPRLCSNVHGP